MGNPFWVFGKEDSPNFIEFFGYSRVGKQGAKSKNSAVLEQQHNFLEVFIIAAIWLFRTHHLVLVACLVQAQVQFI